MPSVFLDKPHNEWIAENELAFAFYDGFPVSPGHALIVTKRVVSSWFDASAAERTAIFQLADVVQKKLVAAFRPDGFNIGINIGEAAYQTVMHLHLHVIPRYCGDVPDPRGGVRHVLPNGNYLAQADVRHAAGDK